jgi:hypothetical protein
MWRQWDIVSDDTDILLRRLFFLDVVVNLGKELN